MLRLPAFDPTRPPPLNISSLRDPASDQNFVDAFLKARGHLKAENYPRTNKPTTVSISELKTTLAQLVTELEQLQIEKESLEKEIDRMPEAEWKIASERLLQMQQHIEQKLQQISDSNVYGRLKQKIHARRKKRAWQKRRNGRLREQRQDRLKDREKLHESIALWQQEQQKLLDEERQVQQQMECASHFLDDVRRRKAACKRHLAKFEKMRKHSSSARREDEEKRFTAELVGLTQTWTAKLADCIKEEKRIKDVLARKSAANFKRRVENEWNRTLFGDVVPKKFEHPLLVADRDPAVMIETRWAWDACLVDEGDGDDNNIQTQASAIPLGWVLPPKDALPEWAQYRAFESK
ncbi:golgin subfamily A member 6-like protein 22 [Sabethes cyaneus]|uniref:golgin subfamily A member 6-like protein 22 n=1 Tax=Sabethes cyaneus TaxID=53552 RepID=UPI00237D6BEB|nr:golgin subfamily A member 6-like protein 22 [Sabethes cyaneus]